MEATLIALVMGIVTTQGNKIKRNGKLRRALIELRNALMILDLGD